MEIDHILKTATQIKTTQSFDGAAAYLIYTIKEDNPHNYELLRLLERLKVYSKQTTAKTRDAIMRLYAGMPLVDNEREYHAQILECYSDTLLNINHIELSKEFLKDAIYITSGLRNDDTLFKLSQLHIKRADLMLKTDQDSLRHLEYARHYLYAELLSIASNLFVAGKENIDHPGLWDGEIVGENMFGSFNIIKSLKTGTEYPFETELLKEALRGCDKPQSFFCELFQEIAFNVFPDTIGFSPEFLHPDFIDRLKLATTFIPGDANGEYEEIVISHAVNNYKFTVDRFLNEFYY